MKGRVKVQRWYIGFKQKMSKVKPGELIEVISRQIQKNDLSRYLPVIRIERNPKGEYYFFLAIESEKGSIPDEVARLLKDFKDPYFKFPANKRSNYFELEGIKPMVGSAHDVTDYTNPIPYRSQPRSIPESPLTLSDSNQTKPVDQERVNSLPQTHEHFLYWLSAQGSGTWESFKKTCQILELLEPRRILRRLKLLGHITTTQNGSKWQVNPPTLSEIETKNSDRTFILCGQRSFPFLRILETYGSLEKITQPRGEAPPCYRFSLSQQISYEALTEKLQKQGYSLHPSASKDMPDIKTWYSELVVVQGVLAHNFNLKQFNGQNFADCTFQKRTGFYQFFSQDTNPQLRHSFFYDQVRDQWMQGDWYGLRFWAISEMDSASLSVFHNKDARTLQITFSQRWSEAYETHLVMASGLLPKYDSDQDFLVYEGISQDLAEEITRKLNITLQDNQNANQP